MSLTNSKVRRSIGTADYDEDTPADAFVIGSHPEHLDFSEKSVTATLNQLVGKEWAFGARYRWSRTELSDDFPGIPRVSAAFEPQRDFASVLQQLTLYAIYNHPSGWFGQLQGVWSRQSNHGHGFGGAEPGDDFWQYNAFVGCRFWQRRAEATIGVLNMGDQNYKLEPLNLYSELPRERTFVARLSFKF